MTNNLKQLTDRIYYLPHDPKTDRPILSAICGTQQTLIVDTGNSDEHAKLFLNEIEQQQVNNFHSVMLTHWHWDHSFGANKMNMLTIAHEKTKKHLEKIMDYEWSDDALNNRVEKGLESQFCSEMIKKEFDDNRNINITLPNITFKEKFEVHLGDTRCIVKHVGGDHSDDSSIIFVEEEKVLFLGDCLYPSVYTKQPQYKVDNVRNVIEKIEMFDAEIYVLSHQTPLTKDEFMGYINLLICQIKRDNMF
ncbi:MBL fold metallo-hydrolase [Virgibacillus sp. Bac330]|uniref:MBL fold metallo-hydrolase n=1 Tax=Virgibacillus sp. Bac330 TaxID=2419841 RepID=UPI000EF4D978|nr:MBL fold metallo-hydrolase [Virgibacillus sp. Bac330]